jgi:hypothetical protein
MTRGTFTYSRFTYLAFVCPASAQKLSDEPCLRISLTIVSPSFQSSKLYGVEKAKASVLRVPLSMPLLPLKDAHVLATLKSLSYLIVVRILPQQI